MKSVNSENRPLYDPFIDGVTPTPGEAAAAARIQAAFPNDTLILVPKW
jgi:hypothetical protein